MPEKARGNCNHVFVRHRFLLPRGIHCMEWLPLKAAASVLCPGNSEAVGVVKIIAFLYLKQKLTFFKCLCSYMSSRTVVNFVGINPPSQKSLGGHFCFETCEKL